MDFSALQCSTVLYCEGTMYKNLSSFWGLHVEMQTFLPGTIRHSLQCRCSVIFRIKMGTCKMGEICKLKYCSFLF